MKNSIGFTRWARCVLVAAVALVGLSGRAATADPTGEGQPGEYYVEVFTELGQEGPDWIADGHQTCIMVATVWQFNGYDHTWHNAPYTDITMAVEPSGATIWSCEDYGAEYGDATMATSFADQTDGGGQAVRNWRGYITDGNTLIAFVATVGPKEARANRHICHKTGPHLDFWSPRDDADRHPPYHAGVFILRVDVARTTGLWQGPDDYFTEVDTDQIPLNQFNPVLQPMTDVHYTPWNPDGPNLVAGQALVRGTRWRRVAQGFPNWEEDKINNLDNGASASYDHVHSFTVHP